VLAVLDRVVLGVVVVTSLLVVAALVLVLLGFRPLVVRSGSMEPTYSVGDVVLVTTTTAGALEPGDVVTRFDSPEALDSLTHRVRTVERDGDSVMVETRGDANGSSEVWTVPADTEVGRVVAHVPYVGKPATLVRTSAAWLVVAVVLVALTVAALFLRPWVARRNRSGGGEVRPMAHGVRPGRGGG
jgi:signal peptidase I